MPRKRVKPAAPRKPRTPKKRSASKRAEEAAFVASLVAHGQAVRVPPGGKLPPGATHELVKDDKGEPKVVRKRFSAF